MKRGLALLIGNDDSRPIRVHIDDLHPASRIRGILVNDEKPILLCNVSRDVIRSLVASQRHNLLLTKGDVDVDELRAELERDCVSIVPQELVVNHPIAPFCEKIAHVIDDWPRMNHCMRGSLHGKHPQWMTGPTHCLLHFPRKPPERQWDDRPLSGLLRMCLKWHFRQNKAAPRTLESVRHGFCFATLRWTVAERGVFWHALYDDASEHTRDTADIANCCDAIMSSSDSWCDALKREVRQMHRETTDLTCVFRLCDGEPMQALRFFQQCLGKRGYRILKVGAAQLTDRREIPLVFPTNWAVRPIRDYQMVDDGLNILIERDLAA